MENRRIMSKLRTIMDNTSHPLHDTLAGMRSVWIIGGRRARHPQVGKKQRYGHFLTRRETAGKADGTYLCLFYILLFFLMFYKYKFCWFSSCFICRCGWEIVLYSSVCVCVPYIYPSATFSSPTCRPACSFTNKRQEQQNGVMLRNLTYNANVKKNHY